MKPSYDQAQQDEWMKLTGEERILESEKLWEEYRIKYPRPWERFWRSFSSFEEYHRWLEEKGDPRLW